MTTTKAILILLIAAALPQFSPGITLSVQNVRQRYPWNGLVDIDYTVAYEPGESLDPLSDRLQFSIVNTAVTPWTTNGVYALDKCPTPTSAGAHRVTWNANEDGVDYTTTSAKIILEVVHYATRYMIIDVSSGVNSVKYPVTYMNAPPTGGFNTDEYKKDKIVLRLIPPGSYMAGQIEDNNASHPAHRVTITKPFYAGLFEVTQYQWNKVKGTNAHKSMSGNTRPAAYILFSDIRGSGNWPTDTSIPTDTTSFMGRLNNRCKDASTDAPVTGFDLPTEFQWEYACRAGTTTPYSSGNPCSAGAGYIDEMKNLGRCQEWQNDGKGGYSGQMHTVVGSYTPNDWGFYDMHGNVWEWCLDWYVSDKAVAELNQHVDPKGPDSSVASGKGVFRGGSWWHVADHCRSGYRGADAKATWIDNNNGFRLFFRAVP